MDLINFKKRIKELINIKTPIIWVNTKEEGKAEKAITNSFMELVKYRYFYIIDDTGTWRIDPLTLQHIRPGIVQDIQDQLNDNSNADFICPDSFVGYGVFNFLNSSSESVVLIIRNLSSIHSNISVQRMLYNLTIRGSNLYDVYTPIVVLSPTSQVPIMLQEATVSIELPLLTEKENMAYIKGWMQANNLTSSESIQELGKAATGLTIFQLRQALKDSAINEKEVNAKCLNDMRASAIKQSGILTYIEPKRTLDNIGGHNLIKNWIKETKQCMSPEAEKFGIKPTKGTICMGLAGTGKSLIAEAIANYFNVPLIIFDLSKIMGGLVGQSERTAREAFEMINALGKCVVLMDEADKKFAGVNGGGEHDGGTFARVFDVILQNLQENQGQFYILTANDISKLPSPIMRSGRLDTKWFFDLPNENDRIEIFKIHFNKAKQEISEDLLKFCAKLADHFTGAEIENAVNNILKSAFLSNKTIDKISIANGINLVSPIWKTNKAEIEELKTYAKTNNIPCTTSMQSFNPPKMKGGEDRLRNLEEVATSAISI